MSYDLMVFNKHKRFKNGKKFLEWYEGVMDWDENVDLNDYKHTPPSLQSWFMEMKDIVPPLNGEFAPSDDDIGKGTFQEADYCFNNEAIYVAFAWSDAERVYPLVRELAKKHDVAFFDVIGNGIIIYPEGTILQTQINEDEQEKTTNIHLPFTNKELKSVFNKKNILSTLLISTFFVFSLGIGLLIRSFSWHLFLTTGMMVLIFTIIWLSTLKTITILQDGLEEKRTILPFIKHFYRFSEFDYAQINTSSNDESFQLIRNGERVVSISSQTYSNYSLLKRAIQVQDKESFPKQTHGVSSSFNKLNLWGIGGFLGIMAVGNLATSIAEYIEYGKFTRSVLGMFFLFVFFSIILLVFLVDYKKIVIWSKQIEVRWLLWPFKVYIYPFSDFDGYYRVIIKYKEPQQDKEECWLVKDKKLILSISQFVYKNYDALKDATQLKFLGTLELNHLQSLKYCLFRKSIINE